MTFYNVFKRLLYFFLTTDIQVHDYMQKIYYPWLVKIMLLVTYMGSPWTFIILSALISSYLLYMRRTLETIFLNTALFSAWGTMEWLKYIFQRNRPMGEELTVVSGYSFPSGHAMISLVFYGFLAILLLKRSKMSRQGWWGAIALFILVLLIGFSRIYLNVHYMSDVLAGYMFGTAFLVVNYKGMEWVKMRLKRPPRYL